MTFVGETDARNTGVNTGTIVRSVTAGNFLVLSIAIRDNATIDAVTDDQSQTWTLVVEATDTLRRVAQYRCANTFTGSLTVTIDLGGFDTQFLWLVEASYTNAPAVFQTDSTSTAASTTHPCGATGVDAESGDLLVTVSAQSSSVADETVSAGWTEGSFTALNGRQYWQRRIATGTLTNNQGTYTAVTSHDSAGCIACYRESAGAGGNVVGGGGVSWMPSYRVSGTGRPTTVASGMTPRG